MVNTMKTQNVHVFILDYPQLIHDLHEDFPLAPEILMIDESMLLDKQKLLLTDWVGNLQFI